jgi:hypothetical protein
VGHHAGLASADLASVDRDLMRTGDLDALETSARHKLPAWLRAGHLAWLSYVLIGVAQFWKGDRQETVQSFERAIRTGVQP